MSPVRTLAMAIEPDPTAVRASRQLIADALDGADEDVVDRALLCASELVTNAIEHAEPPAGLRVDLDDEHVRIEVDDSSERMPAMREPDETSIRGRGMMIVQRCSDRWGIVSRPGGKTVWCELSLVEAQRPRRLPMTSTPR